MIQVEIPTLKDINFLDKCLSKMTGGSTLFPEFFLLVLWLSVELKSIRFSDENITRFNYDSR